ncbi:MAG: oligoendopeptidase F [Candidatus Pacebacteria bacterium]|nr:oligoendopeptidase F [Candidatus Paceibacterota bacterium]
MQKNLKTETINWDLTCMYAGLDDVRIDADVAELTRMAREFNAAYKGKLAEKLGAAITDYAAIGMLSNKVMVYLYLTQSKDTADGTVKAKIADTLRILNQSSAENMTFFTIELTALDESVLEKLYAADAVVAKHRPYIEHARVFKPYILSESVEAALTRRSSFGASAWSTLFDELESDLRFTYKEEEKTLTELLHIISESQSADDRAEVLRTVNSGLAGFFAKYAAQTLYMTAGSHAVEVQDRGYPNPMDGMNKSNRVSSAIVDALHDAVRTEAGPLARRYYKLKAAHLGMKTLKWSDRNAPLPFTDTSIISFDEAWGTVLAAYESFSPALAGIIRDMKVQGRIDAHVTRGRRGGAFNYSIVLPHNVPASFTFLNYLGSNRDVMTLAHELGHGVHGILGGQAQGALMFHAPIAYCETASVFGEMTTFNFLKGRLEKEGDTKRAVALLMGKLDDIINTVVRQISFSNFERRFHGMDSQYKTWSAPKSLSVEELDALWMQTTKELYGENGDTFTYENMEHLWSYIPHFHSYSPFYVYGYAFGELLTHSLYAQKDRLGAQFEPLYLDMLRAGGTKNVTELLAPFGLDPANPQFWADGITISMGKMIEEAEALSRQMGVVV